jgi:cytochrome c-type biogenesis protein CcmH/NrfG
MVLRAHDLGEEANLCFEQAERFDPTEPRWPYLHGLTRVLTDPVSGIGYLERAVERAGEQLAPRLRLVEVLLEQDRLADAERHLERAREQEPDHPRVRLGLARLAFAREDWRGGLKHLEGVPGKLAHTLRAQAGQRLGEQSRSSEELKLARASLADPPWPDPFVEEVERLQVGVVPLLALADELARQGRTDEAVDVLEGIVREHPENVRAWLLLGTTLSQARRFQLAERALTEAVRVNPDMVEAWFELGVARVNRRNPRGAEQAFAEVVRLKSDHTRGYFNLGLCRRELGDLAGAEKAFRRALECQPDLAPARKALGERRR